ncbi:MAG: hypothetical protein J6U77_01455 [Verrucomicrobia bacterium]|nr:hypothetical protein [Verrucomicrobiota bacterium]
MNGGAFEKAAENFKTSPTRESYFSIELSVVYAINSTARQSAICRDDTFKKGNGLWKVLM